MLRASAWLVVVLACSGCVGVRDADWDPAGCQAPGPMQYTFSTVANMPAYKGAFYASAVSPEGRFTWIRGAPGASGDGTVRSAEAGDGTHVADPVHALAVLQATCLYDPAHDWHIEAGASATWEPARLEAFEGLLQDRFFTVPAESSRPDCEDGGDIEVAARLGDRTHVVRADCSAGPELAAFLDEFSRLRES